MLCIALDSTRRSDSIASSVSKNVDDFSKDGQLFARRSVVVVVAGNTIH